MRTLLSLLLYIFIYLILPTWIWGSWVSQLPLSGDVIALEMKKPFIRRPLKIEVFVGLFFSWQLVVYPNFIFAWDEQMNSSLGKNAS